MGEKITTVNVDEYITSYVDREIKDPTVIKEIQNILSGNEILSKKYRSEVLTKKLISKRLPLKEVPPSLFTSIKGSINELVTLSAENSKSYVILDNHPISTSKSFPDYLRKIIITPVGFGKYHVPGYAFAVVLLVIFIGTGLLINKNQQRQLNPFIANGSDKCIMVQAIKNFRKILTGEIKPQCNSSNEADVRKYLKEKLDYDVYIPCIENCQLVGAICNEYNGQKIAHLLYRSGDDIFYICETPSNSINHSCMEIPELVNNEIITNKFYICDKVDLDHDYTMLLWYSGNIVCTSVSTMPKQKVYAAFTNFK